MTEPPVAPPAESSLLEHRSSAFEHMEDGVMITTLDGKIIDWNAGATGMFGWTREEMLGRTPAVLHRECDAPRLTDSINEAAAREGHWSGEIIFLRKDGSTGICATSTVPMRDASGTIFATLGINRDITAAKAAEGKLIEEKRLLQTLIDALADPIFFKDLDGRYILVNAAHYRLWKIPKDLVIGKTNFEIPGLVEHAAFYSADDEAVIRSGEPVVNRDEPFTTTEGRQGWFLTSKFPLRDGSGAIIGLVGIARDVTARRLVDRALADEREKLRTILDALPDPVFVKDLQGRHTLHNAANLQLFGLTPEHAGATVYEMPLPREHAERYAEDDRLVFETGTPIVNREEPFILPDGSEGHLLTSKFPLRDSAGRIVGLVGIGRDVTQLRRDAAEREALQTKLRETQKLESLGVLAGGIAHDFNNLLGVVLGNVSLASERKTNPACRPYLQEVETAATRAADLCKQMLAYSGKGNFVVRRLDLNAVIAETANLLRVSVGKSVELQTRLDESLPIITGDETQLRQVIMNLVINASEAIGEREGWIGLNTGVVQADAAYLRNALPPHDLLPGTYVFLEVSDNGQGMTPEVVARIFDPFFTTKFTGRGLGLAAVLGIVRGHHGALKILSAPGVGTSFKLLLPCAEGAIDPVAPPPPADEDEWRGSGEVLLVDDEEAIRTTVANILELFGFVPQMVPDAKTALALFGSAPERYTLAVLDLTMPGMDGVQLSHELRRIRPAVPILLMSGFNEKEASSRFQGGRHPGFIQKPFTVRAFQEKIRSALRETETGLRLAGA